MDAAEREQEMTAGRLLALTKTLRDGSKLDVYIEPDGDPDTALTSWTALYRGGELWTRNKNRPHRLSEPAGKLTHGLTVAPGQVAGLTAAEAATVASAIERWAAERKQQRAAERAALAARVKAAAPGAPTWTTSDPYGTPCAVGDTVRLPDGRAVTGLHAWHRYFAEDGQSFGAAGDDGYVYYAEVREATPSEVASLVERERREAYRDHLTRQATGLAGDAEWPPAGEADIRDLTSLPGARVEPARVTLAFGAEGAYQHLRIDREHGWLWVLTYNGADGDDWACSNAGPYIAVRLLLTPERAALAESLRAKFGAL